MTLLIGFMIINFNGRRGMARYNKRKSIQKIKHTVGMFTLSVVVGITGCMWAYAYSSQVMQKQNKYLVG